MPSSITATRCPGYGGPGHEPQQHRTVPRCTAGDRAAYGGADVGLLRATIEPNLEDTSFWIRKAIGWALRQYARTDPDWVQATVAEYGARLSGLSRREALKHL